MADNKDPLGILQEQQSATHDPLGILSTDAEKKNPEPTPSSLDVGLSGLKSTEDESVSETPSISKTPSKEDNISTIKAGQIDALKTKTRDQFVTNPIFADSNPNAQRNRDIYINNLKSKGYSSAQINDLKSTADNAVLSKRLVDENINKVNPSFLKYPSNSPSLNYVGANIDTPVDIDATYKTAVGLTGLGKYDEAINLFNATLGHLKPGEEGPANSTQQDSMAMNIQTQKSAATNPSNSLYGIGYALSSKKDYQGSIDYYNQALEADPNNVNAQKGLAYSKSQMGLKDEAQQHLKTAREIEKGNPANEALVSQVNEQAAGEKEQQRVSDQMKGTADALEAFVTGNDPEGKLGAIGYLNPVGKWYSGLVSGEKTIGKGLKEMSEGEIKSGALTTTLGVAETAFAAIPEVTAFNTVIAGVKESAKALPAEGEKAVNTIVDLPFQAASMTAKVLGYSPEEGSDAKKVLEIADIIASFGTMHLMHAGAEKVSDRISDTKASIEDLKNISKQATEGKISTEKLNEASEKMQDITLDDIKAEAEKRDTPEAKEIVEKIVDIQKENAVAPEVDKVHQELADLEAEAQKPLSPEAKDILNQKIAEKRDEITTQAHDEIDSHINDSVDQVSSVEKNDQVSEIDTRIDALKGDLEVTENETAKQSLNDRISDLEAQKEELKSPVSKETKEAVKQDKLATEIEAKTAQSASKVVGKVRDKSFITRLAKESSIPDNVKAEIEKKGLERIQFSNDDAQKIADTVIEDLKKDFGNDGWHDAAISFASEKKKGVPLSINAGIMGRVVGDFIDREKATEDPVEKQHYAEMSADAANLIDESALDFGRFGSMLAKVYQMTPLGVEVRIKKKISVINDAKLDESFKGGKTDREKIKEVYDELEKLKADIDTKIKEGVDKAIGEKDQTLRRKKADKAISKLSDIQKQIKVNTYSSIIPPDLIVAGIEVIKQAIDKGVSTVDAIEAGINHIKEKHKDKWEKEDLFRKDMENALKDLEDKVEPENVVDQEKVLDKIFPKKKVESAAKRKKLHEKILEAYNAGALDYDKFEKLFYDKFGLADVDNGQVKEFLQKQSQRVHDAADGGLKEREYTAMLNFLEDRKKQKMSEWVTTPFYANILSGYETHLNNAQFNIWSTVAQTALLAEKNPTHARYLALQMLKAIPQALTEGGNILKTGMKFGEAARPESLAERRADKGPGISHYYKMPGRLLKAGDAIFNTPIKAMKRAELLLNIAENYNKSLPEGERLSKAEIEASINDIVFNTTERKAEAYDQAVKDIQKLEGKDVDLNDPKIAKDIKLRQFEIMEKSRVPDKYADMNIDKEAVNEEAQDFSNRSLLQGKPVGSAGAFSSILHNIADGVPLSKFAITTFIDVPLNLANMMIDKSPLGLLRMAAYEARGRRGVLTSREFADKNNIKLDLTPDQRKEAWLRAANYSTALVGMAALTGVTYTDKNGKKRPILEVTTDGTGDYQKNKQIQTATGGDYKEYTADFMGHKFSYKYNSILAPILTPIGAVQDYEKYKDKSPEAKKSMLSRVAYGFQAHMLFTANQANLQGIRDIFGTTPGKEINEDNWDERIRDWGGKSGGKVLRNMLVPNFTVQANKDIKGLMDLAEKKPIEWYDYMIKDVPFVESIMANRFDHFGREVKSQFSLPVALVPDKLNLKGEDEIYKMTLAKHYYPFYAKDKTVFDGNDEITLSDKQMSEVNKLRGQYVLDKLKSKEKDDIEGKTYMEFLKSLDDKDFKQEMNKVFKDGEVAAKSKLLGLDVKQKMEDNKLEKRFNKKGLEKGIISQFWEFNRKE